MNRQDTWTRFVREITAWQARNGHGSVGLSTDPADYMRAGDVLRQWHDDGVCGGACKFCPIEDYVRRPPFRPETHTHHVRCPATPPPFKYESQQCDRPFGHEAPHWFDDGWFIHKWTEPHMAWCGLDTDHQGMCHPAHPDHGEKVRAVCGHERPFDFPSGVKCTLDEGHEGCHSAPYKPEYTWVNETDDTKEKVRWHHKSWCKDTHDGACSTEVPSEPTQGGTEAPEENLGVIVLRGIIEALTAALKEIE
jgi:hypothetical protein